MQRSLIEIRTLARRNYKGSPTRVWVKILDNSWQAILINTQSKEKILIGQISTVSYNDALENLREQLIHQQIYTQ